VKIASYKKLVGGFNAFEKYARQIGSFPQVGMKIKNIRNHHLEKGFLHLNVCQRDVCLKYIQRESFKKHQKVSFPETKIARGD